MCNFLVEENAKEVVGLLAFDIFSKSFCILRLYLKRKNEELELHHKNVIYSSIC